MLAAGKVPYIEEEVIHVREGYELVPLPEGSSYLGFIFARAMPRTSATVRSADSNTRGSSSSIAAARYSRASLGSARSSSISLLRCETAPLNLLKAV